MSGRRWNNWSKKHRRKRREPYYSELVQLSRVMKWIGEAADRLSAALDDLVIVTERTGKEMREMYEHGQDHADTTHPPVS